MWLEGTNFWGLGHDDLLPAVGGSIATMKVACPSEVARKDRDKDRVYVEHDSSVWMPFSEV